MGKVGAMDAWPGASGLPVPVLYAHLEFLRQRGQTPGSVEARRRALLRMARTIPAPLLEASPGQLAAWRASLTVTPNTVVGYVSHARDFYAWAITTGYREDNPAKDLPVPKLTRGLPRPIGEAALMDAVINAPHRIRPWLVLAGWAGLRACEISGLKRERVLDTATPPALLVAADATKGRYERVVPMCPFVVTELRLVGLPRSGYVFRRADGRPGPNAPHQISHLVNRHLKDCGTDATLHQLRHRFATQAYRTSGKDLRAVQELLGHRDPATTAGYAAFDSAAAVRAVNALPAPPLLRAMEADHG